MMCTKLMHGRRRAFTLVELLVVIAIIGVLVALLLPALSSARQAANASGSSSNLSSFGRGFELYATNNNGVYSSAAFDHNRDGDIRKYGWVADLINSKVANPGKALDLGSRHKINEKVGDYMGATSKAGDLAAHISSGVGRWATSDTLTTTSGTYFGDAAAQVEVWNDGFNSNYATTWHFSRGDPNDSTGYASGNKNPSAGDGPLNTNHLGQGLTTAARVALMGPARAGDGADALVVSDAGRASKGASAAVMNAFAGGKKIVKTNDLLVESFNDGMNVPYGTALAAIGGGTAKDMAGGTVDRKLHEFNDIEPLHQPKDRSGTGGFAPILFADLHVEKVTDSATAGVGDETASTQQGDGYLGNGVSRDGTGSIKAVLIDANGYNEVADLIWLKRLRNIASPGGGSNEGG